MPQLSLTERIAESFTLARAERAAEATPETVRRGVAEDLALSRQKADAAESLFDNGHPAEAIKLANESLEQAIVAVGWLGRRPGPAPAASTRAEPKPAIEAKVDDAKAEESKSEESKSEESKSEESKSEESKSDESKSDESKSDESKSDDAKSDDAKSDDAKSDHAKSDDAAAAASDETSKIADLAKPLDGGVSAATWRELLARAGASTDVLGAIEAVLSASRSAGAPRLDGEVTPEHATAFHRVLAARVAIDREIHPSALTAAQVRGKRRNRIALTAFVVLAVVLGSYFAFRRPSGTFATASATFNNADEYGPASAMDGHPETEWLLPDHASGWMEINVDPPRRINAVSLVNASNQPHEDRATREYTIELWSHGELARSVEGTLPFSTARNPVRSEFGVDDVERVRVVVRSWHQLGAGLAEVSFE